MTIFKGGEQEIVVPRHSRTNSEARGRTEESDARVIGTCCLRSLETNEIIGNTWGREMNTPALLWESTAISLCVEPWEPWFCIEWASRGVLAIARKGGGGCLSGLCRDNKQRE